MDYLKCLVFFFWSYVTFKKNAELKASVRYNTPITLLENSHLFQTC